MKERWEILTELINKYNCKRYCEVGCRNGIILYNFNRIGTSDKLEKIVLVDIDDSAIDKSLLGGKVTFVHDNSKNASECFENESFDIIFIDADHNYNSVLEDINHWLPKIKKGGIICGHDFRYTNPGVEQAVREVFGNDFNLEDDALTEEHLNLYPEERKLDIDLILHIWWKQV